MFFILLSDIWVKQNISVLYQMKYRFCLIIDIPSLDTRYATVSIAVRIYK